GRQVRARLHGTGQRRRVHELPRPRRHVRHHREHGLPRLPRTALTAAKPPEPKARGLLRLSLEASAGARPGPQELPLEELGRGPEGFQVVGPLGKAVAFVLEEKVLHLPAQLPQPGHHLLDSFRWTRGSLAPWMTKSGARIWST